MKKAVWKMLPVESFDMRGLEEWLSAMAARGLHLAKIGESFARFQPGPPQAGARYALDITGPTDIERDRNEAYAQAGWDYVTTLRGLYYVYRTLDPDAPALHTDPVTQSFTFDRLLRRRLWALVLLIPLILFMFRNELAALIDNPWSPVLTFLLKTEGCCLYLVLLIFYIAALIPLFRQRRALKALRKQLADGIPLEDSRRWPRRVPRAVANWGPIVFMAFALFVWIWNNPNAAQELPNPADWSFPHVTLEQAVGPDVASLAAEDPYDFLLHWPALRRSLLVPEQIRWSQYGGALLEDGSRQECGIMLDLYRARFPDMSPLLLRCVQEEVLARWRQYEEHSGELHMNPELVEFSGFLPADRPGFDRLAVLTWRTADMDAPRKLYAGQAGGLVFTLACSGPADIDRALALFQEVSS